MVLFCASDLLWATRIKSTADALGIPCRPARNAEMLAARLADSSIRAVIVDLEAEHGVELIAAVREHERAAASRAAPNGAAPRVQVVAFGPHVGVERFEEARRAGADRVLARGAFDRALPELLRMLDGGPPDGQGSGPNAERPV